MSAPEDAATSASVRICFAYNTSDIPLPTHTSTGLGTAQCNRPKAAVRNWDRYGDEDLAELHLLLLTGGQSRRRFGGRLQPLSFLIVLFKGGTKPQTWPVHTRGYTSSKLETGYWRGACSTRNTSKRYQHPSQHLSWTRAMTVESTGKIISMWHLLHAMRARNPERVPDDLCFEGATVLVLNAH